jgi:segregation and condensation protein B
MSDNLKSKIESLLFVAGKEMSLRELSHWTGEKATEIEKVLIEMLSLENRLNRGIVLLENEGKYKLASHPDNSQMIRDFVHDERTSELTPASLETLTVIAYRGPIAQFELEQIRGVSCTMILRNLLVKGLIEKVGMGNERDLSYQISFDFLQHLGVSSVKELPNYDNLHYDKNLLEFLERRQNDSK